MLCGSCIQAGGCWARHGRSGDAGCTYLLPWPICDQLRHGCCGLLPACSHYNPVACCQLIGPLPCLRLAAGGMYSRVTTAAERAGVYKGQSIHSFRRGGMQHRKYVAGESAESIQQQAHIKTPAVAARYLNQRRQGVKLAKLAAKAKHHERSRLPGGRLRPVSQRMQSVLVQHGLLEENETM